MALVHALRLLAALALAAGLLVGRDAAAFELRLLTYNTHGLPGWIAMDAPERRFPAIGARTNRYDVALLQEDFAHHDLLQQGARQPLVLRGNRSRMPACPVCSGAGLTTLLRPGVVAGVEDSRAAPYGVCAGWLGGMNDCLATKGFLRTRLRLAHGPTLHVVNTHLDAGLGEADRGARAHQLDILAATLEDEAAGEALVVAGDLNLARHDAGDRALLDGFARRLGLRDTGARAAPGTGWPRIDYVLVRSGTDTRVTVLEAGEDEGFVQDGRPLSDHPALFVRLDVEPAEAEAALSASSTSLRPPESRPR
jgi:endonuclease/exonuclease/phosphatase family metal-dependent hydrolase